MTGRQRWLSDTNRRDPLTISMTIPRAVEVSGIGRTRIYELIREGKLEAKKEGRRTLILADSLRRHVESLPRLAA